MEVRVEEPTILFGSVHGPDARPARRLTRYDLVVVNERVGSDFSRPTELNGDPVLPSSASDDVLYNQIRPSYLPNPEKWVFDPPFYIIINLAVGGSFVGPPNEEAIFPQAMLVDYVQAYKYNESN